MDGSISETKSECVLFLGASLTSNSGPRGSVIGKVQLWTCGGDGQVGGCVMGAEKLIVSHG